MDSHHRYAAPDWTLLRQHLETHVDSTSPGYSRIIADIASFAFLSDHLRRHLFDKVAFENIDQIPPCLKYRPPLSILFIDSDSAVTPKKLAVTEVNISQLIQADYDHFLSLHPVRYDKVKEAIALGEIDMPLVSLGTERFPQVEQGRHRIIALHKFGIGSVKVLVPESEVDEIQRQLKQNITRRVPANARDYCGSVYKLRDFLKNV